MKGFFYFQRVPTGTLLVDTFSRMEGFLLNDTDWINDFKEKRTQYGVSQNRLAVMAGVSRELQAALIEVFSEVHSIERYRQSQLEGLEEPLLKQAVEEDE